MHDDHQKGINIEDEPKSAKQELRYYDNDFSIEEIIPKAMDVLNKISISEQMEDVDQGGAWNEFFRVHARTAPFFKPRRYLPLEFPELVNREGSLRLLEIGCGFGASLSVVLEANPNIFCYACDFSEVALQQLEERIETKYRKRIHHFLCDITEEELPLDLQAEGVDYVLMTFMLSAVHPSKHRQVMERVQKVLKPNGVLLFRDYGQYDVSMLRNSKRLSENLFARADGTLSYFFSLDYFSALIADSWVAGEYDILENKYSTVRNINRKTCTVIDKVFLHSKVMRK